jgi:YbbR domain-containing protein
VRIAFEPKVERRVALAPSLTGSLPEGLSQLGPPVVDPLVVQVYGPASLVESLDTLPLRPVDLFGAAGATAFTRAVDTSGLGPILVSPAEAVVRLLVEQTDSVSFPGLLIEVPELEPAFPLRVIPSAVTVTLVGARSLVESVRAQDLRVTFPLAEALSLAPGEELQVYLSVEGIPDLLERDIELQPDWVTLRRPAGQ